jgi:LacI family transcriptional regulator
LISFIIIKKGGGKIGVIMEDIAREAGVSKATVSRVINGDAYVSDEMKAKVMKVVEKYDYKPHKVAQGLARDLSHTIGLMIPGPPLNITDPFFLEFLHGVGNTAANYNYSLSLPTIEGNKEKELYDTKIDYNQLDGLIVINPQIDDFRIDYLQNKNFPFVFLGRPFTKEEEVCWVDGDNEGGAQIAVDYLLSRGYEKIACITGPREYIASNMRLEGYKQGLKENGIDFSPELVVRGDFTKESGHEALKELFDRNISFEAVFAANDLMAMGAIKALRNQNLEIPEDCAVMGFDGIELGTYVEPEISTIRQPIYKLGVEAAKMLIKLVQGKEIKEPHKILPVKKVIREST